MAYREYKTEDALRLVKSAYWLAWQACGNPMGMGWLQDRAKATAEDVWGGIENASDYGGFAAERSQKKAKSGDFHADYVFGRMMKTSLHIRCGNVFTQTDEPRPDYQSWCHTYPTYEALLKAAAKAEKLTLSPGVEISWDEMRTIRQETQ